MTGSVRSDTEQIVIFSMKGVAFMLETSNNALSPDIINEILIQSGLKNYNNDTSTNCR